MLATRSPSCRTRLMLLACGAVTVAISAASLPVAAQVESIEPVTDAELQDPSPDDWLMWRRTLNGWGYSRWSRSIGRMWASCGWSGLAP